MDEFDPAWAEMLKRKYGIANPMAEEDADGQ